MDASHMGDDLEKVLFTEDQIRERLAELGSEVPVLATTATANSRVVADVAIELVPDGDGAKVFLDGRDGYTSLWVEAEPGTSQGDVVKALKPTVPEGFEVVTGKQASDEAASGIQDALSFITTFLLVFAGVALLRGMGRDDRAEHSSLPSRRSKQCE